MAGLGFSLADLAWLPPPPPDFRERCRRMRAGEEQTGAGLAWLATHRLGVNELFSLGKVAEALIVSGSNLEPLVPVRLGILANGTTQLWAPAIPGSAARHGVAVSLVTAEYDQVLQEALNPNSTINASAPDVVLLAVDRRGLPWEQIALGDETGARAAVDRLLAYYKTVRDGLAAGCGATVIWQTIACPPEPLFGHLDRGVAGTERWVIEELNRHIVIEARARGDCLFDVGALAGQIGIWEWFDPVQWNLHKLPFAQNVVPLFADHVGRILGALRGRSRKCLVLDLDNTLWGGVIGDDGLEGIVIGQGNGEGEAFLEVQRYAKSLRDRGILLAVASKNEDGNARLPFQHHPDMLLREGDIAAFVANWTDKATNLASIARHLNIGVDALVLLDDNPAERAQVRAALPQVAVPELPRDPSLYVRLLASAGYFEAVTLVAEDVQRAEAYKNNALRAQAIAQSGNLDEHLKSLNMVATVAPFDAIARARIAQLINKSNQFNLTTKRYTEAEVATLQANPEALTLQARLRDRFGDNGMISVVICRKAREAWTIDSWLMSCRVLGREVEALLLQEIVRVAATEGTAKLVGKFIPTTKNEMVRHHYKKLGFTHSGQDGDSTVWTLNVADFQAKELPFRVERSGAFDAIAAEGARQYA